MDFVEHSHVRLLRFGGPHLTGWFNGFAHSFQFMVLVSETLRPESNGPTDQATFGN
jgi:hypothetical protein